MQNGHWLILQTSCFHFKSGNNNITELPSSHSASTEQKEDKYLHLRSCIKQKTLTISKLLQKKKTNSCYPRYESPRAAPIQTSRIRQNSATHSTFAGRSGLMLTTTPHHSASCCALTPAPAPSPAPTPAPSPAPPTAEAPVAAPAATPAAAPAVSHLAAPLGRRRPAAAPAVSRLAAPLGRRRPAAVGHSTNGCRRDRRRRRRLLPASRDTAGGAVPASRDRPGGAHWPAATATATAVVVSAATAARQKAARLDSGESSSAASPRE